ncbi:MAG: hypothetical protein M3X11_25550 [Acidobacteriota bacterium]|nr:hypothetical protein [Acidobacteriota bacterium]
MVVAVITKNKGWRALIGGVLFFVLFVSNTASQSPLQNNLADKPASATRAKVLLKRARMAAGFESASGEVQTLSFSAKSQRFLKYISVQSPTKVEEKERTLGGKIEADCWLPDKFRLKRKGSTLTGFGFSYTEIINGDEAWRDPPMSVRSFGRDSRVIDVGDIERTLLMQSRTAKQQIAFYTLGWLLHAPPSLQIELSHAGTYELDGRAADVVVAEAQEGFRVVLLFDQTTHLLAALSTGFFDSYRETVIVETASFDPRFTRATFARAREERRTRTQQPKAHEILWVFSDYRTTSGVTLPYRTQIKFDGRLVEDLTINEVKINQPGNPKKFDGKPEVKYAPR